VLDLGFHTIAKFRGEVGMNQNPPIFMTIVILGLLIGTAWLALRLVRVLFRSLGLFQKSSSPPKPASKGKPAPAWLWLMVIVLLGAIAYGISLRTIGLLFLALFGFLYLVTWLKYCDPISSRALKRAEEGDLDGAIATLIEEIEARGPRAVRLNALGVLYLQRNKPELALEAFQDAEKRDKRTPVYRANRIMTLLRLGRFSEAEPLLRDACEKHPEEMYYRCRYCLLLADLERWDEAREQLEFAESVPGIIGISRAETEARQTLLQECRDRVQGKVVKATSDGLDELV